jgi:hypothetical protein
MNPERNNFHTMLCKDFFFFVKGSVLCDRFKIGRRNLANIEPEKKCRKSMRYNYFQRFRVISHFHLNDDQGEEKLRASMDSESSSPLMLKWLARNLLKNTCRPYYFPPLRNNVGNVFFFPALTPIQWH